jgi:Uma2 family endonuclease
MSPTVTAPALLTAEEFVRLHGHERVELVAGRVVETEHMPSFIHGIIYALVTRFLVGFADEHDLGHVTSNDSFFRTRRDPDTVRGPDVSFYSDTRLPKGPIPEGLPPVAPDLAVEVKSPSNTWPGLVRKVSEYLGAGVRVALVIDPEAVAVTVFRNGELPQVFDNGDDLTLPDVLPGFTLPVSKLFP